jgi:nitric-oxide synthase
MLLFRQKHTYRIDEGEASAFVEQFHRENPGQGRATRRTREVRDEIRKTGTYRHTAAELAWGARAAWRNSSRCIGRLYWRSLQVRDRRGIGTAAGVAAESVRHLIEATGAGKIRATITVFAPDGPDGPGPRIWNDQLIRYAGYPVSGGCEVLGDPGNAGITKVAKALGWEGGKGTQFDVLPLVVEAGEQPPELFTVPPEAVLEVPLRHPDHPWFAQLGLRWHAVPAVSNMTLEIGGVSYPAAPFNGWYQGTEIGARNLGDHRRYNLVPILAELLGLDLRDEASLWRDRALVELNVAVLRSFRAAGVTITDHHTEARRFLTHVEREEKAGRICPADWSWIVPPISGSATPVFHRTYQEADLRPNFLHRRCPYGRAR